MMLKTRNPAKNTDATFLSPSREIGVRSRWQRATFSATAGARDLILEALQLLGVPNVQIISEHKEAAPFFGTPVYAGEVCFTLGQPTVSGLDETIQLANRLLPPDIELSPVR